MNYIDRWKRFSSDKLGDTNVSNDELDNDNLDPNFDNSLIQMKVDFIKSFGNYNFTNQSMFNAQLDLIHLLDATQTPIYLYDKIIDWIKKHIIYNTIFTSSLGNKNFFFQ